MKKISSISGIIAAIAIMALTAGTSQAQNLVLNGSFETTVGASSGLNLWGPSYNPTMVPDWTSVAGAYYNYFMWPTPPYDGDYIIVPQDGAKYVSLTTAPSLGLAGAVYQEITLTAGQTYDVSFWEVNRTVSLGLTAGLYSDAALTTPISSVVTASNPAGGGWQQSTFSCTPTSSGTAYLGFKSIGGVQGGANLDNVVVTAIPEPSTWALVGLALVPLFFRRSRKI